MSDQTQTQAQAALDAARNRAREARAAIQAATDEASRRAAEEASEAADLASEAAEEAADAAAAATNDACLWRTTAAAVGDVRWFLTEAEARADVADEDWDFAVERVPCPGLDPALLLSFVQQNTGA